MSPRCEPVPGPTSLARCMHPAPSVDSCPEDCHRNRPVSLVLRVLYVQAWTWIGSLHRKAITACRGLIRALALSRAIGLNSAGVCQPRSVGWRPQRNPSLYNYQTQRPWILPEQQHQCLRAKMRQKSRLRPSFMQACSWIGGSCWPTSPSTLQQDD